MTLNTQTQPSICGPQTFFGRVARLVYDAWGEKALMQLAPTRRLDD